MSKKKTAGNRGFSRSGGPFSLIVSDGPSRRGIFKARCLGTPVDLVVTLNEDEPNDSTVMTGYITRVCRVKKSMYSLRFKRLGLDTSYVVNYDTTQCAGRLFMPML